MSELLSEVSKRIDFLQRELHDLENNEVWWRDIQEDCVLLKRKLDEAIEEWRTLVAR